MPAWWSCARPREQEHRTAGERGVRARRAKPARREPACERRRAAGGTRCTSGGSGRPRRRARATRPSSGTAPRNQTAFPARMSGLVGTVASSAAKRPPARSTRAHSREHRVEVDEVAQREPAHDAVEARRRRTGARAPSARTSGASVCAAASMPAEKSTPIGVDSRRAARSRQRSPVPHARSSTRGAGRDARARRPCAGASRRSSPSEMTRFMRS